MTIPFSSRSPLQSLQEGRWFKLICGASYHHLPVIRNLALAYTLAGADCIDLAADPAIVSAAAFGVQAALALKASKGTRDYPLMTSRPWLMISLNDGEDPHFRKATFDPAFCPSDCSRPCERVCPAYAISFEGAPDQWGVVESRCYGCGRCLPICPLGRIEAQCYSASPAAIAAQLFTSVEAVEIHTQIGREREFQQLWQDIQPWVHQLKLVAISCPDGEGVIDYLWHLWDILRPLSLPLIWQTDGRPMSGDIGRGTTTAAIRFSHKVLEAGLPGYVQLAGGTNGSTVEKLRRLGLLRSHPFTSQPSSTAQSAYVSGVAYGSYARKLLMPVFNSLEGSLLSPNAWLEATRPPSESTLPSRSSLASPDATLSQSTTASQIDLENVPDLLANAVQEATALVSQIKTTSGRVNNLSNDYSPSPLITLPP